MKIIAFGGSYNKGSINRKFAAYAASYFEKADVEVLDLNDYPLPLFTVDLEKEIGHPMVINHFLDKLGSADLLIVSVSENNGSYSAAFKNLFDWVSRVQLNMFEGKKMLLLSTSPGARGGMSVLETAKNTFPRHGAEIIATFSLPRFTQNFLDDQGITDQELRSHFEEIISNIQ